MDAVDMDNLKEDNSCADCNELANIKARLGLENNKAILMVSTGAIWKRLDRGIFGIYWLKDRYGIDNVKLLIVGAGDRDDDASPFLISLAEELGVSDQVIFLGRIPHKEIGKYFILADAFLSLFDIGNLCNPVLEAMYLGMPIISIDDGSTVGLLEHKHNALLIDIETIEVDLPFAMKRVLEDDRLRKELSDNAKKTSDEMILGWQERMKEEIDKIDELINRSKLK